MLLPPPLVDGPPDELVLVMTRLRGAIIDRYSSDDDDASIGRRLMTSSEVPLYPVVFVSVVVEVMSRVAMATVDLN